MYAGMRCAGMVPQVCFVYLTQNDNDIVLILSVRCLVPPKTFGDVSEPITPCTTEHTVKILYDSELLHTWDTFGMISNVVVCASLSSILYSIV